MFLWSRQQTQTFEILYTIGVLKSFPKFRGKHLHWNLIFTVADFQLSAYNFIKKDTPAQVHSCKFLRILVAQTTSGRLLSVDLIKNPGKLIIGRLQQI